MTQRKFKFPRRGTWGGKRKGAGRPRKDGGDEKGVTHLARPVLKARFPVLVTWRMGSGVWNLRSRRCFTVMRRAMVAGAARGGFRLVHYAVMGNHVHLIVEAPDRVRLSRGLQGVGIRLARALNRVMARQGRVVADRYHARILKTPSEVRGARGYLRDNAKKHYGAVGRDPYVSDAPVVAPRTWLLSRADAPLGAYTHRPHAPDPING